jgi:hypothetical protein
MEINIATIEAALLKIIQEASDKGIFKEELLAKLGKKLEIFVNHCLLQLLEAERISTFRERRDQNPTSQLEVVYRFENPKYK